VHLVGPVVLIYCDAWSTVHKVRYYQWQVARCDRPSMNCNHIVNTVTCESSPTETCHLTGLTVMLAGLSTLPILSFSVLLLLRCRRSKSAFLSPAGTAGELTATGLRTCTERGWWWCDVTWPKRDILCVGARLCSCTVLDGGEWSSFSSGSSYTWQNTFTESQQHVVFKTEKQRP
jgi:hypothetical protein